MRFGELKVGQNFRLEATLGRTFKKIDRIDTERDFYWVAVAEDGLLSDSDDIHDDVVVIPTDDRI